MENFKWGVTKQYDGAIHIKGEDNGALKATVSKGENFIRYASGKNYQEEGNQQLFYYVNA
ncbi:hypothetical protein [Dyadobacter sp. 32]|uniref:hypothetical protein n=1 Tax=Dyadobacter sp. 32 TaxID=538966 RepID=UPI0011EBE1CD